MAAFGAAVKSPVLNGYVMVSLLARTEATEVWRVRNEVTGEESVAKICERHGAMKLEKEMGILKRLQGCVGVLPELGMMKTKEHKAVLMTGTGGDTLKNFLAKKLPVAWGDFYDISIGLMKALGHIHAKG